MTATNKSFVDSSVDVGDIELRVPAEARYLPIIRSLAATIAMREDYDLDFVADLKLAVEEACSMLVGAAWPGTELRCRFRVGKNTIGLQASALSTVDALLDTTSFGWRVLTTLADTASTRVEQVPGGYRVLIELTKRGRDRGEV
ncbi:serine/threonine-protein kinase RsbW [Kibdelosporangium banguiense]|uniref:Serine/threonine-protein kinase RsbW n=1 Tax=Kibdelosporangium banguiense TaxID=1365924 RepID=A0ABS4U2B5_9PSEU|nr:ATP-binding protein [Kibdelosporangium banguiense]MBP2330780.1 serine/threonine-protein kinase RsbW [Kibdelosporangium banguiense]